MAQNVIAQVVGGTKQVIDNVSTVADVRRAKGSIPAGYKASINGNLASDSEEVSDGDYVSFAEAVKGA